MSRLSIPRSGRAPGSLRAIIARTVHSDVLFALIAVCLVAFWGWELDSTLNDLLAQEQQVLEKHQRERLAQKGEEFRDLFNSLYQAGRTISLLPMVRDVKGGNRRHAGEDAVRDRRFSLDAHRTVQQIYANLRTATDVSEIYYVRKGFRPELGEAPFFVYDDYIAAGRGEDRQSIPNMPAEVEDFEYRYFGRQFERLAAMSPVLDRARSIDQIRAVLSPLMRTCDNTQFESEQHGNLRDVEGFILSVPVYELSSDALAGLIAIIVRANVLEARLIGVPFIPVTADDRRLAAERGMVLPEPSSFVLHNRMHGIEIADRRAAVDGRFVVPAGARSVSIDIATNSEGEWTLTHHLGPTEIGRLVAPLESKRREAIAGRVMLLALLALLGTSAVFSLRRWRRDMAWLAQHDALTELPNRRLFFSRLEEAIARARRDGRNVGLFFIDIRDFSAINDTLGHQGGDHLLVEVARRLRDPLRVTDSVIKLPPGTLLPAASASRLGGDEFAIILDGMSDATDVGPLIDRVLARFAEPVEVGKDRVEVSVSMGVAVFPVDASDAEHLLLSADSARAQCRQEGAAFRLFNEDMRRQVERQHVLSVELQTALHRKQFELFYQPKQRLADGRIVSFEALLRWRHPVLGMVSPAEFIPLLERSGLIAAVGEWVLQEGCRGLKVLEAVGDPGLHVSLNVSVRQLRRADFAERVDAALRDSGADPSRIILEVTESTVMDNLADGVAALNRLRELGVKLAIDDFGTGYSSLTYLQFMPIDYIKLDKSFIDGMDEPRGMRIVEAVVNLARGLSLQTIAEGIEREDQREMLRSMDCDLIQGYLLSRPMPLDAAVTWVRTAFAPR